MRNTATEGGAECSTVVKIVNGSKNSKQCKVLTTSKLRYTGCILHGAYSKSRLECAATVALRSSDFSDPIYNYIILIIIQSQYNYVNALSNLKLRNFMCSKASPKRASVT